MPLNTNELQQWVGRTVIDGSGDKIGKIADIYLDDDTNQPEWLAVHTGFFGSKVSFIPMAQATPCAGDELQVPFEKAQVKDAPHAEPDGALSQEEESRLYSHYGMPYSEQRSDSGLPAGGAPAPQAVTGGDEAMTRSEEELEVGKTRREAGRARLRKWVETEHVATTVPVAHEEVRVEREPITDGNIDKALKGPEISEGVHEVVLTEEEVVANTEVVPKERVRLETETVVEEQRVEADLRKEHIEVEGDARRP
jgi:uncharacterized protein (TIGR02271 family)